LTISGEKDRIQYIPGLILFDWSYTGRGRRLCDDDKKRIRIAYEAESKSNHVSSGGRCAQRMSLVVRINGDRPVIHLTTLLYPTERGLIIRCARVYQKGDVYSILGKIAAIAKCLGVFNACFIDVSRPQKGLS
jgi:hypothetical protein